MYTTKTLWNILTSHLRAARTMHGFDRRFWRGQARKSLAAYRASLATGTFAPALA